MQKNKIKIDGIDKEIIRMLIENARRPILEIAKKIGISGAAIHQRLRKLEKSKLINGSSISIDPKVLGYNTMAYIGIFLDRATKRYKAKRHCYKKVSRKCTTVNYGTWWFNQCGVTLFGDCQSSTD